MTIYDALKRGEKYLEEHQIPDAAVDAWYLMEYVLEKMTGRSVDRAWFLLNRQEEIVQETAEAYEEQLARRGTHIPLQYLTGRQEFMGLSFQVNENVLIPRQDTEILVEEAKKVIRPHMEVLDLCTGSGCIIISLMKRCPEICGTASDLSRDALRVAKENARRLGVTVDFREGDLFGPIEGKFDVIVSNPPYIPTEEIRELMEEVGRFEPIEALDGHEDGLYFYRRLAKESGRYLKEGGWLLMEIGCSQAQAVAGMMEEAGFCEVSVCKDLAGLDRVVKGRIAEKNM